MFDTQRNHYHVRQRPPSIVGVRQPWLPSPRVADGTWPSLPRGECGLCASSRGTSPRAIAPVSKYSAATEGAGPQRHAMTGRWPCQCHRTLRDATTSPASSAASKACSTGCLRNSMHHGAIVDASCLIVSIQRRTLTWSSSSPTGHGMTWPWRVLGHCRVEAAATV